MDKSSKNIGVDLAKSVFQLALADCHYHVHQNKRLNRARP